MNAVSITPCGQCPTCKTYVPIPSDLLNSLNPAPPVVNPVPSGIHANAPQVFMNQPNPGYIPPTNPGYIPPTNPGPFSKWIGQGVGQPDYPLSDYESSWRSRFWRLPVLIHSIVEIVLSVLICILEIASLGVSTYSATGAGIWCNIPFMTAAFSTLMLVRKYDRSRLWATRVLIAQLVLIVFSFILIGIVGSFVSTYGGVVGTNSATKYHIMQAQLAFAILLLFAGIAYVIFYGVVTYLALWQPFKTLDIPHLFRE